METCYVSRVLSSPTTFNFHLQMGQFTHTTISQTLIFMPASFVLAGEKINNNNNNIIKDSAADAWTSLSSSAPPEPCFQRIQKAWDRPVIKSIVDRIALSANSDVDRARLKAATAPHSGDWLHAAPIASIGLKLTNEEIRISVVQWLGIWTCSPYTCICGKLVDAR